jgi:uncharacterized delta-60 repeat protein
MKRIPAVAFAVGCAWAAVASANDGQLDPTFGNGGVALAGITNTSNTLNGGPVLQADGKILVCNGITDNGASGADFFVARFSADGVPDDSFSFDGTTTIDFDGGTGGSAGGDICSAIAVQADGKIVVVGVTSTATSDGSDFAVARLNPDGTLDSSFGAGTGKAVIPIDLTPTGATDSATSLAIQADGKIVIAGTAVTATGSNVALVRLSADGSRDSAFNLTGKVNFSFGASTTFDETDNAFAVVIDSANRILVSGTASYTGPDGVINQFAVARVRPNGQLDADFHASGRVAVPFDPGNGLSNAASYGLTIQRDGKIVLVGAANSSTSATANNDVALARLLADGSLDASFGIGGRTLVPFDLEPNGADLGIAVAEQSNGKLVIVGAALNAAVTLGAAVRLDSDGTPDSSFGVLGKLTYDFGFGASMDQQLIRNLVFQGTQIVVSGIGYVPGGIDMYVARLSVDQIFADGFE